MMFPAMGGIGWVEKNLSEYFSLLFLCQEVVSDPVAQKKREATLSVSPLLSSVQLCQLPLSCSFELLFGPDLP